jgi:hypothetical protein
MRRPSIVLLVPALALLAALAVLGRAEDRVDLEALREGLLRASSRAATDAALDALAARIGQEPGFADHGAYADYLGRLPAEAAGRSRVRLRRGWAYLAAGRREAAVGLLEALAGAGGEDGPVARAYLGEAARQAGDLERAVELLAAAAAEGYRDAFVAEAAHKAAFQLRSAKASKAFEGLPDYVGALERVLAAYGSAAPSTATPLHGVLARWLLDDYGAYAVPGRDRATLWAARAAEHALAALVAEGALAAGDGARLAFDAAAALEPEDRATGGRTLRFDLLAWAWRLGDRPDDDTHALPAAVALLAEAALAEGRYELAARLARQRLDLSDSPAARRVLAALPPDVGD